MNLPIAPPVARALQNGEAVVVLESTVVTHGLPRPRNLELAFMLEETVKEAGAVPATVGVVRGEFKVGLSGDELSYLAHTNVQKASLWNLAAIMAKGESAGTTVATTLHAAAHAGIEVFATGGIGGIHLEDWDESADLTALSRYSVITVCAGPKSVLNVAATLERLETLGVPVVGYGTDRVAGFHTPETLHAATARCDAPEEVASVFEKHRALGFDTALLVTNSVLEGLEAAEVSAWLQEASREAEERGVKGKDVTPYLLSRLAELSGGRTVEVNVQLLRENARLAAATALALSRERTGATERIQRGKRP